MGGALALPHVTNYARAKSDILVHNMDLLEQIPKGVKREFELYKIIIEDFAPAFLSMLGWAGSIATSLDFLRSGIAGKESSLVEIIKALTK